MQNTNAFASFDSIIRDGSLYLETEEGDCPGFYAADKEGGDSADER